MKTKKILAIVIAAMMMFALLPATVFAADTTFTVGGTSPTHATIQAAIAAVASAGGTGTWRIDVKAGTYGEEISIVQKAGKNIELVGEAGTVITGGITVDGEHRHTGAETLLIKNIKFDKSGATTAKDQILLIAYAHKVTIEDCTFIGESTSQYIVGVRAGSSGNNRVYDITIKNCVFRNLHSAVQARCMGLIIDGCTTENLGSGGINAANSENIQILNSQISGPKYGLRMGEDGATSAAGTIVIRGSTISGGLGADGEGAIYFRGTMSGNLDIDGSDIIGRIVSDSPNVTLNADNTFLSGTIAGISPEDIIITNSRDGRTEVTADVDVTYTVIIPASVDFGTINKKMEPMTKNFAISVQDALLEASGRITVAKTSTDMNMYAGSKTLAFTFTEPSGGFVFTGNDTKTGTVGCIPSQLTAAGSYKGYMTFSVSYVPAA